MKMNTPNAAGFIAVGLIMAGFHFLPTITGVRETWLLLMGGVMVSVGCTVLAHMAWLRLAPRVTLLLESMATRRADARAQSQNTATAGRRLSI